MIAGLHGRVDAKTTDAVLVDVGGVVYRVLTSRTTLDQVGDIGDMVRVVTYLFVREDQLTLYGFATGDELHLFETLISVTGIGPRLACAILSRIAPDALQEAIVAENADYLATVPGVGKKTAARVILELRGKLAPLAQAAGRSVTSDDAEVAAALQSLGYTAAEAHGAVFRAPRQDGMTIEERVVAALRELAER